MVNACHPKLVLLELDHGPPLSKRDATPFILGGASIDTGKGVPGDELLELCKVEALEESSDAKVTVKESIDKPCQWCHQREKQIQPPTVIPM